MSQKYCLVYSTCPESGNYSSIISQQLIESKLAACVNIVDNITSVYAWNQQITTSREHLLIIKTTLLLFEKVKEKILALHPYACPEIIAVPIIHGASGYISWLNSCLLPVNA